MWRDRLYTTLGFTQSSVWEVAMLHAWASGSPWVKPYYADFWAFPAWSIAQVLLIGYFRDAHFYVRIPCEDPLSNPPPWASRAGGVGAPAVSGDGGGQLTPSCAAADSGSTASCTRGRRR